MKQKYWQDNLYHYSTSCGHIQFFLYLISRFMVYLTITHKGGKRDGNV